MNRAAWISTMFLLLAAALRPAAAEPPAINPFGPTEPARQQSYPGYVEMSDGTIHVGRIRLTRGKSLEIFDRELQRRREIPLGEVEQIECRAAREWLEKEWKFRQLASSEKVFTGRTYPAREYHHQITLHDGQKITGDLSCVLYVEPDIDASTDPVAAATRPEAEKYILYKRHKGAVGSGLESLVFVRMLRLGEAALAEGRRKLAASNANTEPD